MSDTKKKLIKIAGILVLVGLAIFWAAMVIMKFDFNRLSTMKFETNTYKVEEDFDNISIEVETEEVAFVPSEDGKCKVVCEEPQRVKHSVEVKNGTLKIRSEDKRKWYDYIGIGFWETSVTVYLPKDSYDQLTMVSATGDIEMPEDFSFEDVNITASTAEITWEASVEKTLGIYTSTGDITLQSVCTNKMIEVSTSTGEIKLNDVTCENIDAGSSTGDITLKNVIAKDGICIGTSTGDVEFDGSDAEWISVNTTTGDVSGTLLSDKIFMVDTSTGKIEVPKTTTGGKCEIETNTGDIELTIK